MLSGCTLISPNATPEAIPRSFSRSLGLLNKTIPGTNHARVRFITQPVYIVDATKHLAPSSRIVPSPPGLTTVIQQLLLGPSAIEASAGYSSALPKNEVLVSAEILAKVGYIDFAEPLNSLSRTQQLLAVGELVLTAYDVGATLGVVIKVAGVTQELLMPNGQSATLVTKKNFEVLLNV
jgi:spore germination protein GerM